MAITNEEIDAAVPPVPAVGTVAEGVPRRDLTNDVLRRLRDADVRFNPVTGQPYVLNAAGEVVALGGVSADAVDPPPTNLTAAAGAAGALTGTYYYATAFLLDDGSVTPPWNGTATGVVVSAQRINLTSIPVSPSSRVVGRVLLRTPATPVDPKAYQALATINDNTTTTYEDNTADGSLGDPASWTGTASGQLSVDGALVIQGLGGASQSIAIGQGANAGYASVHIGWDSGKDTTTGRRNTSMGVYSLESVTTGYQNTAIGTHAGGGITSGVANTTLGYAVGGTTKPMNNFNVFVGNEAAGGSGGASTGSGNVGVGYRALHGINTADQCVGVGYFAGQYANASRQLFIDNVGRADFAAAQNSGLIYGKGESTAQTQVLHLNAATRVGWGAATVAQLPAASAALKGFRAWVGDASVAYASANVGSTVAGGGANAVPVFCNGTAWVIG